MRALARALVSCGVFLLSGCDSDVSIRDTGGSGGSGGEALPIGAGGAGGAGGATCTPAGGCDFSSWCDFPTDNCGGEGVCVPAPTECPADCEGVCSCDGAFYCNACLAHAAGIDVDALGDCAFPDVEYSAYPLPTDAPRLVLFKADFGRDRCIRVTLAGLGGPAVFAVEVVPTDWTIEDIVASDHVSDCGLANDGFPVQPQGASASALSADGTLSLVLPYVPCGVSTDMALEFAAGLAWVDELETFQWEYASSQLPCDP